MKARIFEIKRFAVHDGDGIRTTVFFKGCPLRCKWCHNPEGLSAEPELAFYESKCIGCGECVAVCKQSAHVFGDNGHVFERGKCVACGKCEEVCLGSALYLFGREYTADEVFDLVMEDEPFFRASGGGITLSGGECLMQADFCAELLSRFKAAGVNTAVDTCGFAPKSAITKVLPFTDVFLFDIKAISEEVHIACTGKSNAPILSNIRYVDSLNKKIEIRVPFVPGYNDGEMSKIADFVKSLSGAVKVRVLPYHNLAGSKYAALGTAYTFPARVPTTEEVRSAQNLFDRTIDKTSSRARYEA